MSPKFLFIIGTPRSGTTWSQILLSRHPGVATGRETHLFTRYLGPLLDQFRKERVAEEPDGLWVYFDQRSFIRKVVGPVLKNVLAEIRGLRPGADLVLEKTPSHERYVDVIHEILGRRAFLLHVVRDPRAVFASYKAAARQDWGEWANQTPEQVATRWRTTQRKRSAMRKRYGPCYREIRYEDLHAAPQRQMAMLLDWLGLPYDDDLLAEMVSSSGIDRLRDTRHDGDTRAPTTEKRSDFFRTGTVDGWRDELTGDEIAVIERTAAAEMRGQGYEPIMTTP